VSRRYFTDVNTTNTIVNAAIVTGLYDRQDGNIAYANRRIPGAVVAVPTSAFAQAQPVARVAVRPPRERVESAPVQWLAAVQPTRASLAAARKPAGKPPAAVLERPVVARTAPPPAPAGFERREQQMAKNPGRPLDRAALQDASPGVPGHRGKVQVVQSADTPAPTAAPPAERGRAEARGGRYTEHRTNEVSGLHAGRTVPGAGAAMAV
jgi:hypothetical protein